MKKAAGSGDTLGPQPNWGLQSATWKKYQWLTEESGDDQED
ncbi:hypothetical protein [Pelobacter propionicus]|nr:hypothetical protein [Pelobacter propionicus]